MKKVYVVALKYRLNAFEDYDAVDLGRISCCSTEEQAKALARATCTRPIHIASDPNEKDMMYIKDAEGTLLGYIKRETLWGKNDDIQISCLGGGFNYVMRGVVMHYKTQDDSKPKIIKELENDKSSEGTVAKC